MTMTRVKLKKNYRPTRKESYMCPEHLEYFRQKLVNWREELVEESRETIANLQHEVRDVGDEAERATRETENSLELRDQLKDVKSKVEASKIVGEHLAKKAREKKIKTIVFDRNGYKYHGRVKALAEGARQGGLEF